MFLDQGDEWEAAIAVTCHREGALARHANPRLLRSAHLRHYMPHVLRRAIPRELRAPRFTCECACPSPPTYPCLMLAGRPAFRCHAKQTKSKTGSPGLNNSMWRRFPLPTLPCQAGIVLLLSMLPAPCYLLVALLLKTLLLK
jgi:hypothetical protein